MEDKKIIDALEEYGKIGVKQGNKEYIIIKKSKYMATLDFIENMLSLLLIGGVITLAICIL